MGNITDFVKTQGKKTFAKLPFTAVDAAVLSQLSYLKFEHFPQCKALLETISAADRERLFEDSRFGSSQREIYFEAVFSRRYQNMGIDQVTAVMKEEPEVGFCSMVFRPEGSAPVLVLRGTDEYLVGWKEDFQLGFKEPIPSHTLAVESLKTVAEGGEPFIVCGHSKGGNLAVYGAVNSPDEVRAQIKFVYNLDGPGFKNDIADSPRYGEMRGRIMKIVPDRSVVGRLLKDSTICTVVESRGVGILQHMLFNWEINDFGDFIHLGERPNSSGSNRLSENIAGLTEEQMRSFVESLFDFASKADMDNLAEFQKDLLGGGRKIFDAYTGLDDKTRRLLTDTIAELL